MNMATAVHQGIEDLGVRTLENPIETRPARGLEVELIEDYEAFLALAPQWNELVVEAGIDHPFLRHEWVRTWWECFDHGGKLHILLVKDGDDLIGIAPLMLDRGWIYGWHARRLRGIANVYTERFDFILAQRPKEACQAIWNFLASEALTWDMLELRQVPEGGCVNEFLPSCAFTSGYLCGQWHSSDSPYIPITHSFEQYRKSLSKRHLSNLKSRTKGLHRLGEVKHEVVMDSQGLDRALDEALLLEAAAWKGQAGTAIISRPERKLFYRQFMRRAAERGWLQLHFLTVEGKRIATQLALQMENKLYLLKSGYDPHYANYTPSLLLCELMLHDAWKLGLNEIEFLGDAERWKMDWASQTRSHSFFFVFPNRPRARLVFQLKFSLLPRFRNNPIYEALRSAGRHVGFKVHSD